MHPTVKIMCSLFLLIMIQSTDSFPQFSVPFVSWNKNKEELSRYPLNVRAQNPFSSIFGKSSNSRQYAKTYGNNEVVKNYEKIITVTPNTIYYANYYEEPRKFVQPTQDPRMWGTYVQQNQGYYDSKGRQNMENYNYKKSEGNLVNKFNFNDDVSRTITDCKETTEYTTESATEYESTTEDLSDLNRSGVSGHVVASLLG